MIIAMVAVSVIFENNEIIFPEIFAIVIGAWISEKQPWKVGKIKMLVLITAMAFIGILFVRFVPWQTEYKIIAAFFTAALVLFISKCTFLPIISACVLPIIMGTESIIYPISVFVMMTFILVVKNILENKNIVKKSTDNEYNFDFKTEAARWLMIFLIFSPICFIAVKCNMIFLIAPPLLVAFSEFTYADSQTRKTPVKIWLITSVCAVIGAYSRCFLSVMLNIPIVVTTAIIAIAVIVILVKSKTLFPPSGALSLLPMIIPEDKLIIYPFLVILSSAVLIFFAMLIGKVLNRTKSENVEIETVIG